jgi:hypothetical protein
MSIIYVMDETRGLEGTGISAWDDHHTEHLARRAAELGDTATEALCDAVLAGLESADLLIDVVGGNADYNNWMARGVNLEWETR